MSKATVKSIAMLLWQVNRSAALDEFEEIHSSLGAKTVGIRRARNQINQAYALMLSGQFQGYCRDLHSEAVDHLTRVITPVSIQAIMKQNIEENRKLDSGNPNPGNIGSDFNRFGMRFWDEVYTHAPQSHSQRMDLDHLNRFRNDVAHQTFGAAAPIAIRHAQVKTWRRSCDALALAFEAVVGKHLTTITGVAPW